MENLLQEEPEKNENDLQGGNTKKSNSKLSLIIFVIVIALLLVGAIAYYFVIYNNPTNMFKRLVEKPISYLQESLKEEDYKTVDTSLKLDLEVAPEDEEIVSEDVLDLINSIELALGVKLDKENKKLVVDIDSDYKNEELISGQVYSDVKNKQSYVYSNSIFDKYLEVDMEDEYYEGLEELFEPVVSKEEKISFNQAFKIIKKEVKNIIKDEYCDAQKEEIEIDGKKVKVAKNTLTMTTKQLQNEMITVLTNLKDNEKFIECFEEKDDIKSELETAIDELKQLEGTKEDTISINIYTTGLLQKVVRVDFVMSIEETGEFTLETKKVDESTCQFKVYIDTMENSVSAHAEIVSGKVVLNEKNKNEATLVIDMEIIEFGKVKINLESSYKVDEEITIPEIKDSVNIEELTETDMNKVYENLQNSKIYELIENFSGEEITNSLINSTEKTVENNENLSISQNNKLSTSSNEIVTYDKEYKILFNVPQGYESNYTSDNYKTFDKDDVNVTISTDIGTATEYFKSLESTKKYFEETGNYKDITISDIETKQINGKTFQSKTLKYKYVTSYSEFEFSTRYMCTPISDDIVLTIEIEEDNNISEEELNQFLNVTIQKI